MLVVTKASPNPLHTTCLQMGLEVLSLCMALLAAKRFPPRVALTCMCGLSSASLLVQSLACGGARPRTPHVLAWCAWGLGAVVGGLMVLESLTGGTRRIAGKASNHSLVGHKKGAPLASYRPTPL